VVSPFGKEKLFLNLKIGDSFVGVKGAIHVFKSSYFPANSAQAGVRI